MDNPLVPAAPDALKNWMISILTLVFVILYAVALIGWISSDTVKELQPIVFVIIGYYFGRLPALQNEESLKQEIKRHADKTDEAETAKTAAQVEKSALEAKLNSVRAALTGGEEGNVAESLFTASDPADVHVRSALRILNY